MVPTRKLIFQVPSQISSPRLNKIAPVTFLFSGVRYNMDVDVAVDHAEPEKVIDNAQDIDQAEEKFSSCCGAGMAKSRIQLWATKALVYGGSLILVLKSAIEVLLRLLGPIFIALGFGLISYAVFVHFTFVLPWYADGPVLQFSLFSLVHLSMDIWLCIGIAYNYFKSAVTAPLQFGINLTPAELAVQKNLAKNGSSRLNSRFCKYCEKGKTDRVHHCHVCNTCVPGMDHHCPWIGNCVGFHNHHYFILFLVYLFAGCVYASSMSFYPFILAIDSNKPWPYETTRSAVVFSFVLAVAVACSLMFLGGWQVFLVISGQTSVEYYIHKDYANTAHAMGRTYRNPHDLGTKKNFQQFFGVNGSGWWFAWLVPGMANPVHLASSLHESQRQKIIDQAV